MLENWTKRGVVRLPELLLPLPEPEPELEPEEPELLPLVALPVRLTLSLPPRIMTQRPLKLRVARSALERG